VNERGLLVAVTNRRKSQLPPRPRSRGLLARDLLGCRSSVEAVERACRELGERLYAGINLLCVDREAAIVIQAGDWLRVRPVPPGLHLLTNEDVNDATDRRLAYALAWLGQRAYSGSLQVVEALKELCSQPGNGTPAICLHEANRGTVSSS